MKDSVYVIFPITCSDRKQQAILKEIIKYYFDGINVQTTKVSYDSRIILMYGQGLDNALYALSLYDHRTNANGPWSVVAPTIPDEGVKGLPIWVIFKKYLNYN